MKAFLISFAAVTAISVQAFALAPPTEVWIGDADPDSNWSTAANWQDGSAPLSNANLHFQGSHQTTNNNDYDPGYSIGSLTFDANAASFTLQGNPIVFFNPSSNTITNNSTNTQTLSFSDNFGYAGITSANDEVDVTVDAASGNIRITSNIQLRKFQVATGGNLIVTGSHDTTITGVIDDSVARSAGITKNGTGTLTLSSDNNYRGGTTITAGTLVVDATNALGVQEPNVFATTHNDVFVNGGTLRTAEGMPRTFVAPDEYTQAGGATLRMQIGGLNAGVDSDLMQVGRSANLAGELFVHQINGFMPTPGDTVTIITTNNGTTPDFGGRPPGVVNGEFDTVTDDFPGLITAMAEYFNDHVDVVFDVAPFASITGLTRNQRAVANALDEAVVDGCVPEVTNFLVTQDIGVLRHDFDLIAPEELASIYEIGFSQAVVFHDNLMRRMDDIRAGSNGYCGPVVETSPMIGKDYNPPIQDKNVVIPDKNVAPAYVSCPENHWGIFATGSGDFVNVDGDENARGYDITTGSFTAGVDYRVGNHFAIGIDGGYSSSRADLVDHGHVDVDGGKIGGYATFYGKGLFGSRIYIDGAVSGGWNSYDTRRTGLDDLAPVGGYDDTARGSTNGSELNAMVAYGSDWTFGCFNIGTWSSIQYTNVSIDGFTETGSLAPLVIEDQDQSSFRGTTGIRASYDFHFGHCGIVRPEIRAAWQHEYGHRSYAIDSHFIDCDTTFTVHGPEIGRDAGLLGTGLNVQWSSRFATYVYYDGVLGRSDYNNNAVSGGLRFGF